MGWELQSCKLTSFGSLQEGQIFTTPLKNALESRTMNVPYRGYNSVLQPAARCRMKCHASKRMHTGSHGAKSEPIFLSLQQPRSAYWRWNVSQLIATDNSRCHWAEPTPLPCSQDTGEDLPKLIAHVCYTYCCLMSHTSKLSCDLYHILQLCINKKEGEIGGGGGS